MKGIIFDLDGVIALTEDLHYQAFCFAFAGYGIDIPRELWDKNYAGKGHKFIINSAFGENPDNERHINKWVRYYQFIAHRAEPVPGVIEYINSIDIPMIIATGSAKASAEIVLAGLKIDLPMVSMEDFPKPKPDPGLFLLAAQRIGINPYDCMVYEDTPFGIDAAKRAGMKVTALTTTHSKKELQKMNPDKIIKDFTDESTSGNCGI